MTGGAVGCVLIPLLGADSMDAFCESPLGIFMTGPAIDFRHFFFMGPFRNGLVAVSTCHASVGRIPQLLGIKLDNLPLAGLCGAKYLAAVAL